MMPPKTKRGYCGSMSERLWSPDSSRNRIFMRALPALCWLRLVHERAWSCLYSVEEHANGQLSARPARCPIRVRQGATCPQRGLGSAWAESGTTDIGQESQTSLE